MRFSALERLLLLGLMCIAAVTTYWVSEVLVSWVLASNTRTLVFVLIVLPIVGLIIRDVHRAAASDDS